MLSPHRSILTTTETLLVHNGINNAPTANDGGNGNNRIPLESNPVRIYLGGLLEGPSRNTTETRLRAVVRLLSNEEHTDAITYPWNTLTLPEFAWVKEALSARMNYRSTNSHIVAIRSLMRVVYELGLIDQRHYQSLLLVKRMPGSTRMAGRALSNDELKTLYDGAGPKLMGARRRALLALLYGCGMRIHEAATMRVDSLILEGATLFAVVVGKGNKERRVPIPTVLRSPILLFANNVKRRAAQDGRTAKWLFGKSDGTRPADEALRVDLQHLAKRLGVDHFTPHDMRRTYISNLFDVGVDVAIIARLVGHANIQQTAQYDRRPESAQIGAVERLPLPC